MPKNLILILVKNLNVIIKRWTKSSLNQETKSDFMNLDDSESNYTSKSQFYFLRMDNQCISKYSKILQNIQKYYKILQNITKYYKILQNI
jgi:DUF4097 and DUF4098 domain-containing protein YvlB